jgi:hypothetical protein
LAEEADGLLPVVKEVEMGTGLAFLHPTRVDPLREMEGLRLEDGGALEPEAVVVAVEAVADSLPAGVPVVDREEVLHLPTLQSEGMPAPDLEVG